MNSNIISDLDALNIEELMWLRREVDKRLSAHDSPRTLSHVRKTRPPKDRTKEMEWLAQNREAHAGRWVAIDGDSLIAHSQRYEDVSRAVDAAGVRDALIMFVESRDALPFAGF